ncbi:MAG: Gfo/Idh/MocA family oxidoreductase [Terracidiphilus sp.]|jgi:predicted dehydrogenase
MKLTRRDFARFGALGLAARFTPALEAQSPARKTGYAIIGIGTIAYHFMAGIQNTTNSRVTGLVSGHRDKADRVAAQYSVPANSIYSYDNFDEIARNPNIDAVYVALPNSMHAEYTIRAAKAGKHVLCEKPMCTSVADAEAMIAACKAANVKLMIAYRCHYEPLHLRAIQMIRDGKLGQVQEISSCFGFNSPPGVWRLNKKLAGGGPLYDVGIYSLNATRYLTGEEPAKITAVASTIDHDGRFNEVEENVAWTTIFPSGIVASCSTSYGANTSGYFKVYGSKGWLALDPGFNYDGVHMHGLVDGQAIDELNPSRDPYQFTAQADHFSHCVQNNLQPNTPGEEGLKDMRWIADIYRSAGIAV